MGSPWTVEKGSIYGLVGPNGAGKSTILRHITGIYRPDSGTITVDGAPVYENPAVKSRVAFIPDDLYYFLSASTRDMMKFYRGLYPAFDDKRYQVLKEAFPAVDEKQPIRRLSKGMQKQSAFWLALCCQPRPAGLGRAGGRPGPGDAASGLVPAHGGRGPAGDHGAGLLPQPAGAGGRVRPRGHPQPTARCCWSAPSPIFRTTWSRCRSSFRSRRCPSCPEDLDLLHVTQVGRIHTLIVRGSSDVIKSRLAAFQPILMEALPLTLEEIFIYELGGEDYAVRDIVL